jgi:urocanate hydratase
MNKYIYVLYFLIIIFILRLVYSYYNYKSEQFDNSFKILKECKDITPSQLLKLFDNDVDKMTNVLLEHNIPTDLIKNTTSYPVIASYLVSKNVIKCE